jgi:inositol phosphorylceramide mannosyltransferase catalytic subunit
VTDRTPRVVHFVWVGPPIPASLRALRDRLLDFDPGLEVRIWDDESLRSLRNRAAFEAERRPAAKADIARYEILLEHGGLYLDADFDVHRSIEPILAAIDTHGLVVARQSPTVYNNAFLGARPRHPVLQSLVDAIPDAYRWMSGMTAPAMTGPHLLTEQLLRYLRAGGQYLELPQHAVFPWYSDETPLARDLVPDTVLLSHEWATMRDAWSPSGAAGGAAGGTTGEGDTPHRHALTVDDRRRLTGRSLRGRAAAAPSMHAAVARLELLRTRLDPAAARTADGGRIRRPSPSFPALSATDERIERWFAGQAARALRGSAVMVDVDPASALPTLAALRTLDRPGRTITVVTGSDERLTDALVASDWSDPAMRCSTHLVRVARPTDDVPTRITSRGTPLMARPVDAAAGPNAVVTVDGPELATLLAGLPRIDVIRVSGRAMTVGLGETLRTMFEQRRITRLALTIDPMSTEPGTDRTVALVEALSEQGVRFTIGPWLLDPRGRTWRQHLRVAARPFTLLSQLD